MKTITYLTFLLLLGLGLAPLPALSAQSTAPAVRASAAPAPAAPAALAVPTSPASPVPAAPSAQVAPAAVPAISPLPVLPVLAAPAPVWQPLLQRLAAEGVSGPDVDTLFARMGSEASQEPMGRKVKELYVRKFVPPPPRDPAAPVKPRPTLYPNVVTAENVQRCRDFLQEHATAFALSEVRYHVPKEIAVALLFVETRLGGYLGKAGAFYTLASMAVSTEPQSISQWLPDLPGYEEHLDWMRDVMPKRAEWAYKEMRALLLFTRSQGTDPLLLPGSIYGAIGLCQFMPSNLNRYAVDGDGDGVVDLFRMADAVPSLCNYLVQNGWKPRMNRKQQHAALKAYNRIDIYANTILTLADAVAGRIQVPAAAPAPAVLKQTQ